MKVTGFCEKQNHSSECRRIKEISRQEVQEKEETYCLDGEELWR